MSYTQRSLNYINFITTNTMDETYMRGLVIGFCAGIVLTCVLLLISIT
jgi:tetrahydromethanopterin S-methyltransferase subunit F